MKLIKLAIATSFALALSACSDNENAQSHLVKAKEYINAQKINESIIELKNALKIAPKNAEVRFLLGQLYLSQGRGADAVKELERAKTAKYSQEKVIPLLARAYIITEADDDVLALSIEATTLPADVKSHYLAYKVLAALRSEKPELAESSVEVVKSLSSTNIYSFLAEAYLVFSQQKFDHALNLVNQILSIKPNHPDALMLQGQISIATNDFKQASVSFEQYLSVQPYSGLVQLLLADALLKAGEMDKAEQHADIILANVPNQPFANYIKAMVRFTAEDYEMASEHAELALQGNFKQFNLKLVAGASAFKLNKFELCNHHLSSIASYLPKNHIARRMLAVSQLELGLVDEISDTLNGFQSANKEDDQFLTSLSFKLLELGAISEAKQLVGQISGSENATQSAREGILKLMMNDPSGMQDLQNAINLNPDLVEAELVLAFAALQSGDIKQAETISARWREKYPEKAGGYNLLAAIYFKQNQMVKAKTALEDSLIAVPDNLFAMTELVKVEYLLGNKEQASALSTKTLDKYPNNLKALRQYFELHQSVAGLQRLKLALKEDRTSVEHGILYVEALINQKKLTEALEVLNSYKLTVKTPKKYWQLLYRVDRRVNGNKNYQSILEKWKKTNSFHIEPTILLADLFSNQSSYNRAISLLNTDLEQYPNNLILRMFKLHVLIKSQQIIKAKQLFNILKKEEFDDGVKKGFQGRIFLAEKEFTKAIPPLKAFYLGYPKDQNVLYLSAAYQGNNELKKSIKVLELHLKNKPESDRIKAVLAAMYLGDNPRKAITIYEDIIERHSKNVVINNNMAWLYMENGDLDKAMLYAKKAYELAPKIPNVIDTYSQVLFKSGNKRLALEKAEIAFQLSENNNDIDITLNYIELLIENGRKNKAVTLLKNTAAKTKLQVDKKNRLMNKIG